MKRIVPEFEFTPEAAEQVKRLAVAVGVHEKTAGILYARGIDSEEKAKAFLSPSKRDLLDPMLMKGMREAKELLTQARDEEWRVAVFGDYDADGIGALAIMSRALKEFGIEPYLYVPERADGYGLSVAAIDRIFDEFLPDLVVTVDCGISCADEVEYIKRQGAFVIVTDHHELPVRLPDCITINPKLQDDYPYDNLCGAGVAYKLAAALLGERANGLLDFCALSTVADSVPLTDENRIIVTEGLKLIASRPRPAFSALIGKTQDISAQTLAFTVAPRLNAAGRMGDAASALRLFTSDDEEEIYALAAKLNDYNAERQKCCDELFEKAESLIREKGAFGRVVMLAGEHWNTGFVGIVAAKRVEEYGRPALLFVKNGDVYKGSARSVEGVNIFEALTACSQYIEEFGGHAQAAGVSVKKENFEALERALDEYLSVHYTREDFMASVPVAGELDEKDFKRIARELERLEPFGVGNRRPLFVRRAQKLTAEPLKPLSPHLTVSDGVTDFMYFGGAKQRGILKSEFQKTLVFECNISRFRGKESVRGFIRSVLYDGRDCARNDAEIFENNLLSCERKGVYLGTKTALSEMDLRKLVLQKTEECDYGTLLIASERETLDAFPELDLPAEVYRPAAGGMRNLILISPAADADFAGWRDIIYLDKPLFFATFSDKQNVYYNAERRGYGEFLRLDGSREKLVEIFVSMRNHADRVRGETPLQAANACDSLGFGREEFMFAVGVFSQLGFIRLNAGGLKVNKGVKAELTESSIYAAVTSLTDD